MADLLVRLPDEMIPEAHQGLQGFYETTANGHKAGTTPPDSTKVGWTLRDAQGNVVDAMAFLINPQGLDRASSSRSQLFATKGGFYVDNFGAGPTTIQLRQLVAQGKDLGNGIFYTSREDVQRFIKSIYLPAMDEQGPVRHAYFHDNHLERGFEEHVWFPEGSLTVQRAVDLHNVWAVSLTMISLERRPFAEVVVNPTTAKGSRYVVKKGDTLTKIVSHLVGAGASSAKRKAMHATLMTMNPDLSKARPIPGGGTARPLQVYPGELLRIP